MPTDAKKPLYAVWLQQPAAAAAAAAATAAAAAAAAAEGDLMQATTVTTAFQNNHIMLVAHGEVCINSNFVHATSALFCCYLQMHWSETVRNKVLVQHGF